MVDLEAISVNRCQGAQSASVLRQFVEPLLGKVQEVIQAPALAQKAELQVVAGESQILCMCADL